MMKKLMMALFAAGIAAGAWADVAVTAVKAQQRYPWNGLVDIEVQLSGTAEELIGYGCVFTATNVATKAEITTGHVIKNGSDIQTGGTCTRHYIWDAKTDVGSVKIDDIELLVGATNDLGGIQLWEGGPYFAECNVGATEPEEYGYYFWWGDTVGYTRNAANNGWVSVKDGSSFSFSYANCPTFDKSNTELQSLGFIDSTGNLTAAHDAATALLGAPWRMPTDAEFSALINNCDTEWTSLNGIDGLLVKGRGAYASRSIFLPAAGIGIDSSLEYPGSSGYCWSSTSYSDDSLGACSLYFNSFIFLQDSAFRNYGWSVRPVRESTGAGVVVATGVGVSTSLSLGGEVDGFEVDLTGRIIGIVGDCPETITIPAGVTGIAVDAFKDATNLKHLIVESLDWVKGGVSGEIFSDCPITEITLNESVGNVNGSIFKAIPAIEKINVPSKAWWIENVSRSVDPVIKGTATLYVDGEKVELGAKVVAVKAQQRYPWKGLVDIEVQLSGTAEEIDDAYFVFAATNVATKAELATAHIEKVGEDAGSGECWTRHFVWDAKADVGSVKIDDIELLVGATNDLGGIQLWEGGPYFAECNVGATEPEEYGYYFWWGDTVGYTRNAANNGWVSVKDGSSFSFSSGNGPTFDKSNSELQSLGFIDSTGNLTAAHDAATAHLGAPWRMTTDVEFSALINNCDTEWTSLNGVDGRLVKGRGAYASRSIFLPAAGIGIESFLHYPGDMSLGCYWSSTPYSDDSHDAWSLIVYSYDPLQGPDYRYYGHNVRPVRESTGAGVVVATGVGVSTSLSLGGEVDGFEVDLTGRIIGIVGDCPETITIPEWATGIAADAFKGATNLKHLIVESLDWAKGGVSGEIFSDCPITEITLNESVGKVNGSIFKAIPTIEKINVPSKEWWLENAPTSDDPVINGTASMWVNDEKVDMHEVQAAFKEWVQKYGVTDSSTVNVNAFVLGMAPTATEEAIQEAVEEELKEIDLAALSGGDISTAVKTIQAKYPNAKVELAPVESLETSAHLYKLVIKLR